MSPADLILRARSDLRSPIDAVKAEDEGGCGVVGLASTVPVRGYHILCPVEQMHNRGNGKGGGIAAVGLVPEQMRVPAGVLKTHYLLQIGYLDESARPEVEAEFVHPHFDVHTAYAVEGIEDPASIGLDVRPPLVWRYFVRVKPGVLQGFLTDKDLADLDPRKAEDEFVFQNTYRLNAKHYASLGDKRAFVLSHGRNLLVFKIVGYAEQAARYYKLEDLRAHVWIGHQRYPTKGRVWHPGGAHPFIGLDEALVHNGDFANYHSVVEYLKQRNIHPLFLTDTEVSVLLFDLLKRVYGYPLEYVIEAMAPTTERDFAMLPPERQQVYRMIQAVHMHGSPDGPWFFILGRTDVDEGASQLIGITDTSMLRPQVFALQENPEASIGLIASEKQAIDAALASLAAEDRRFLPVADRYWNARGGSHTDGGAFVFSVHEYGEGMYLRCTNKFGDPVTAGVAQNGGGLAGTREVDLDTLTDDLAERVAAGDPAGAFDALTAEFPGLGLDDVRETIGDLRTRTLAAGPNAIRALVDLLTLLLDRSYPTGGKRRAAVRAILQEELFSFLRSLEGLSTGHVLIGWESRSRIRPPRGPEDVLVVDARGFPPEGDDGLGELVVAAHRKDWRRVIAFDLTGQRFLGCGLGADSHGFRLDLYGSPGDYLASGLDGAEVHVHANGQDQMGQILKAGKLVVHGDLGQTFMYAAKGGEVYVRGSTAGRSLINAVGKPRVVINGTSLDYLAESFMAGDALKGGGFVVLNGIRVRDDGGLEELPEPYPGGNLFSLASGGAIYIRDPKRIVGPDQLNGGMFDSLGDEDWNLILPYLEENERLFGIKVRDLLTVDGARRPPHVVYRKVKPVALKVLAHTGL